MENYQAAAETLGARQSRKLENNTYLQRRDKHTIAVLLHSTDIVTFKDNGETIFNTGGWHTVTTKDRMQKFSPLHFMQKKGVWYVGFWTGTWEQFDASKVIYQDGLTVKGNKITGAKQPSEKAEKAQNKIKRDVARYVTEYMRELDAGNVPAPSAGDCFYCSMFAQNGHKTDDSHIKSHIEERYYVPSLLVRAIEAFPVSIAAKSWYLASLWDTHATDEQRASARGAGQSVGQAQLRRSLTRYIKRQFGFAA